MDATDPSSLVEFPFVPLGDRIIIQRDEAMEVHGKIILPKVAQTAPRTGVVLSVGPGRTLDDGSLSKMAIKEGDRVLFSEYAGMAIEDLEGWPRLRIMREDDVLCRES